MDKEHKVSVAHGMASKVAGSAERSDASPQTAGTPVGIVPGPGTGTHQVVVEGRPLSAAAAAPPERDPNSPYIGPSDIVEGGRYMRGTKLRGNKHYGGDIADAHGNVLATFEPDEENTGNPDDGKKPE
jgi:hypothetical protein